MNIEIFYPELSYPELYADVMLLQIFPDSKTFADASPLIPPNEINSLYRKINHLKIEEVREFVLQYFQLPGENLMTIDIEPLPIDQHLTSLWNHLLRKPDHPKHISSLIPLPYSYVVPGGRFREIYYWDSYFTMLGLKESGRTDIIREMIKNFAWQLEQFDHIPNGNRSYFLSRSQPPFFSLMITLLAEMDGQQIYQDYLPALLREYSFWMDGIQNHPESFRRIIKVSDGQYLNRYYDDSDTPRAESWAEDVHSANSPGVNSKSFYRHIKAACESGWDFSSRWFAKENDLMSIHTTDIIPVDLNSLLYLLELTIARSFESIGDKIKNEEFEIKAKQRKELISRVLWNDVEGIFSDRVTQEGKYGVPSLAMMYPLFAGIASQEQANRSIKFLVDHFLRPGGWVTTNQYSGQQWDAPNGWPPLQWITYIGLKNYGATNLANDGARRWLELNQKVFNRTGRMMEKYNVEDLSLDAGGGEYPVQDGFGWTNGIYLALSKALEK